MNRNRTLEGALSSLLRNRMAKAIKDFPACRLHGVRDLGCSLREFITYIEGKWADGMTWENHGPHGWHLDHVRPLASVDFNDPDEAAAAARYTNYQPLWAEQNRRKSARWSPPKAPGLALYKPSTPIMEVLVDDDDDAINRAIGNLLPPGAVVKKPKGLTADQLLNLIDSCFSEIDLDDDQWKRGVTLASTDTLHLMQAIELLNPGVFGPDFPTLRDE